MAAGAAARQTCQGRQAVHALGDNPMEAVIVSTARTPLCKSWRGALNMTHGAKMGGHVVHAALERARVDADEVEDVIIGCANPEGATGWNIARQIAVRAGCPRSEEHTSELQSPMYL